MAEPEKSGANVWGDVFIWVNMGRRCKCLFKTMRRRSLTILLQLISLLLVKTMADVEFFHKIFLISKSEFFPAWNKMLPKPAPMGEAKNIERALSWMKSCTVDVGYTGLNHVCG
jgi:hypothetical protein